MTQAQLAQGTSPLLAVRDVSVVFGGIVALNGVSFDMHKGQILGLIGPNGAGKTTLFNCLSRLYQPSSGDILMEGASILKRPKTRMVKIGTTKKITSVMTKRPGVIGTNGMTVTGGTIIVTRLFLLTPAITSWTRVTGIQPMATIHCRAITTTMAQSTRTVICFPTKLSGTSRLPCKMQATTTVQSRAL